MAFNILIIDDSKIIRSVIKKTLEISGIPVGTILEASNGLEGLTVMRENWVDLVFADLNMPVMNGLEMLDMMAQEKLLQKTPVLICSTEGSKTRSRSCLKKACGHLSASRLRRKFSEM